MRYSGRLVHACIVLDVKHSLTSSVNVVRIISPQYDSVHGHLRGPGQARRIRFRNWPHRSVAIGFAVLSSLEVSRVDEACDRGMFESDGPLSLLAPRGQWKRKMRTEEERITDVPSIFLPVPRLREVRHEA